MDKELLEWGIKNSDPEKLKESASNFDPKKLDPELVDFILGHKTSDGSKQITLQDCVEGIKTKELLEERLSFFEHLHMLVEDIDHAISMENLKLWPDIIALTDMEQPEEIRVFAFWTMATASHHNPKVQEAILKHGQLSQAFASLQNDPSAKVRLKCISLISALVKQNVNGFLEFNKLAGIQKFYEIFRSTDDEGMKERISFFLAFLFEERPRLQKEHPVIFDLISQHRSS